MMCVKLSFFVLCVCFFMHASTTLPLSISHAQETEVKKLKLNKFGPNGKATFGQRMPIKITAEDHCKKYKAIKGGTSRADCKSSLHKDLMQRTKPEDSRSHLNVREMASTIFSEDNFSETDYQPPHRKPPIHNK